MFGGGPYASYDDVVEEALCFGWIDSVRRSLDADRSQLLVTRESVAAAGPKQTSSASSG